MITKGALIKLLKQERTMLGYDVTITAINADKPFHLAFSSHWQTMQFALDALKKGEVENEGDAWGYPFKFTVPWKLIVEGLDQSKTSGPIHPLDPEQGTNKLYPADYFDDEQPMTIEMWDKS